MCLGLPFREVERSTAVCDMGFFRDRSVVTLDEIKGALKLDLKNDFIALIKELKNHTKQ